MFCPISTLPVNTVIASVSRAMCSHALISCGMSSRIAAAPPDSCCCAIASLPPEKRRFLRQHFHEFAAINFNNDARRRVQFVAFRFENRFLSHGFSLIAAPPLHALSTRSAESPAHDARISSATANIPLHVFDNLRFARIADLISAAPRRS